MKTHRGTGVKRFCPMIACWRSCRWRPRPDRVKIPVRASRAAIRSRMTAPGSIASMARFSPCGRGWVFRRRRISSNVSPPAQFGAAVARAVAASGRSPWRPPAAGAQRRSDNWVHLTAYSFDRRGMFTVTLPDGTVWQQDAERCELRALEGSGLALYRLGGGGIWPGHGDAGTAQ